MLASLARTPASTAWQAAKRHAASASVHVPEVLIASAAGNISKLGGAVASRLREGQVARLSAIGPPALHSALRSLTLSGHWLSKEKEDQELLFIAERHVQKQDQNEYIEMRLVAELLPKSGKKAREEVVPISQKTNVGQAAAFMASRLAEEPDVTLALRSVGAVAGSQAIKALVIARKYVQKAHPGEDLVVCAREEAKADNSMASRSNASASESNAKQMVLACRRQPARERSSLQ
ncbi:erg10 [Symbiodinium sp. CCMP2592]|nr:erg10 [Symbiodinium sp. CCMP2592]